MLRCLIMGAAGRDFHDFQTFFRAHPELRVVAFTAEQIPFIDQRTFPASLAGPDYPDGVPIYPESRLDELIERLAVDMVFLAYSDLAHGDVMHKASRVLARGAGFALLGPRLTMLASTRPVVAVTAVRTGAGKSPLSQAIVKYLTDLGVRVGVIRHPMPYGDLERQAVQRFATVEDLDAADCTIEEREEYAPYVERGFVIYAGVDYAKILERAQADSDVILWDGGNNDFPFVRPDLWITVVDALRPGHEVGYHPGETNLRSADVLVINKVDAASPEALAGIRARIAALNPRAVVVEARLAVDADAACIAGRRVLVIEDGPTVTHGGMPHGAGHVAALAAGASELVDARPFAIGTIAQAMRNYPHIGRVLPALGYSAEQRAELAASIRAAAPDVVVDASPARIGRMLALDLPVVEVGYRFVQTSGPDLLALVAARMRA